jgi:flavin-binding protein dodecin
MMIHSAARNIAISRARTPGTLSRRGCLVRNRKEAAMPEHIYKVIELVGSSPTSIEDAISTAIGRASETIRHLRWFEVMQMRGHVENGKIAHYQVMLKVGFTMEGVE